MSKILFFLASSSLEMPKRSANDIQDGQPFQKTPASGNRREVPVVNEMGDFEDAWEDEIESDEEVADADSDSDSEEKEDGLQSYFTCSIWMLIFIFCIP
jgi:hypothetical protein